MGRTINTTCRMCGEPFEYEPVCPNTLEMFCSVDCEDAFLDYLGRRIEEEDARRMAAGEPRFGSRPRTHYTEKWAKTA